MSEDKQETIKEEAKEGAKDDTKKGDKPQAVDPIGDARKVLDETRAENDRREKLLAEEKELAAVKMLGGGSQAGSPSTEKKEETNQEYVDRMRANGWKANG